MPVVCINQISCVCRLNLARQVHDMMLGDGNEAQQSASWMTWFLFNVVIATFLYLDIRTGETESTTVRRAAIWSAMWVALALVFAAILWVTWGPADAATFLVGYVVEKSLSVDNLLVILLIFKNFRIKPGRQPRVLKWGIIGAIVMRAGFIFMGIELLERFEYMVYIFGALLVYAAWGMLRGEDDDEENDEMSSSKSPIVMLLTLFVPYTVNNTTTEFFVRTDHTKRLVATPMFAALLVIEGCDVIFAIDSIPCILGITHNRFLVYSSNMLAILGLRALYVLLADALRRVRTLQTGLGLVLAFVGVKMMLADLFPIGQLTSLSVIVLILGGTVLCGGLTDAGTEQKSRLTAVHL